MLVWDADAIVTAKFCNFGVTFVTPLVYIGTSRTKYTL